MGVEFFKGDTTEKKVYDAGKSAFDFTSIQLDAFFEDAYKTQVLGDLIYTDGRTPLAKAIKQSIFRQIFTSLFESFIVAGSLESYLSVFKAIFGNDVEVEFTVPAPGKLNIDIVSTGIELADLLSRYIENNAYLFDEIVNEDGDNIALQVLKGFDTQYEVEQMLFEMVPGGIFTNITLTVG